MTSKQYLTEAYNKYYHAFIKKAMMYFDDQKDKAFDCVQEIVLRLLLMNFPFESVDHARSIIYKNILWQANHIKQLRKKWGACRERNYDFTNAITQDALTDEVQPIIKDSLDYWPQSNKFFNHINKLNPYHQKLIKLHMNGVGNTEAGIMLGKKLKNTVGSSKDEAFKMLRGLRVANKLRDPLDRSKKRQGADDRTDKIMEMTAAGVPDKVISEKLGLTLGNIRCRRYDRKRLLEKIKHNNNGQTKNR